MDSAWKRWCRRSLRSSLSFLSLSLSFLSYLSFSFFFFFFFFFFSCSFSCSCSWSFSFSSLSPLLATNQPTRRPTSRHLNVIWRRASAQQSVLSLLLSPPSSLLSLPSSKKRKGTFYITGILPARNLFLLQF